MTAWQALGVTPTSWRGDLANAAARQSVAIE